MVCRWRVQGAGHETRTRCGAGRRGGRPNWWVILAVSLASIALLVETSGRGDNGRPLHVQTAASTTGVRHDAAATATAIRRRPDDVLDDDDIDDRATRHRVAGATRHRLSTCTRRDQSPSPGTRPPIRRAGPHQRRPRPRRRRPPCRPTAARPRATSIRPCRTRARSRSAAPGPTEVSVVWSAPVYLTMTVTCPERQPDGRRHDGHGAVVARRERVPGHRERALLGVDAR